MKRMSINSIKLTISNSRPKQNVEIESIFGNSTTTVNYTTIQLLG